MPKWYDRLLKNYKPDKNRKTAVAPVHKRGSKMKNKKLYNRKCKHILRRI